MIYKKVHTENNKMVVDEEKEINQDGLTSECWLIQFDGLNACENCEFVNTDECGGKNIRKKLLAKITN